MLLGANSIYHVFSTLRDPGRQQQLLPRPEVPDFTSKNPRELWPATWRGQTQMPNAPGGLDVSRVSYEREPLRTRRELALTPTPRGCLPLIS